ncbi:YjbQ family protein [Phytoactinopolyspora alkaliphila]|uniref:YjbQ family protein n=1 Tax=Phytoactinopolyspora alkaliphila TaxID=1783498 RepID=A0A6N9YJ73_9ACTN|nr:YjbQ family protein [Phytoactinopolyspora alkaliphila]NED94948.1 YjbQ family protein [Phytoactinopolyspora alkaliphila]
MHSEVLQLNTGTDLVTDVTSELRRFCGGLGDGLCHLFVPHATAGLAIMETGAGSEPDLADAIDRFLPREDIYRHQHGSVGHGRDHVLPAFVAPSISIPVLDGEPALGTWQSVVVVDSNTDNQQRTLRLSFLASP